MTDQFQMSDLPTWLDTPSATSSQASGAGPWPSDSQDGLMTDLSGPAAAPASLSASQAKDMGWLTSGTYGRIGSILYGHSDLQLCLVNRLKQRLPTAGSTLFKMTWKAKVTPSGQSVSLLRASGLRTSDKGSGSWPTPVSNDDNKSVEAHLAMKQRMGERDGTGSNRIAITSLAVMAKATGWPTTTRDWKDGSQCDNVPLNALLGRVAWLAEPWSTPRANKWGFPDAHGSHEGPLPLGSWGTPNCMDSLPIRSDEKLSRAKSVAGCSNIRDQVPNGMPATGSPAATASGGQLNPAHSRWLMGYPTEWDDCAPTVTPSSRKSRRK